MALPSRRSRTSVRVLGLAALLTALVVAPAHAQSILRGALGGAVQDSRGDVISGAQVVITEGRTGRELVLPAGRDGSFAADALAPGDYEVRVEARGFRPRIMSGVYVSPGATIRLNVSLEAEPPPVVRIDTVVAPVGASARFDGGGGFRSSLRDIAAFPTRSIGWPAIAALSPAFAWDLTAEGLPSATAVMIDGIPFSAAVHPGGAGAGDVPLFLPSLGLDGVAAHRGSDVEWTDGAGSQIALTSRAGGGTAGVDLAASGSGGGLWTSEPFTGATVPDAASGWAGIGLDLPLTGNGSQLRFSAEGMQTRVPHLPPLGVEGLGGLEGIGQPIGAPWTEERRALSALARLGATSGSTEVVARSGFATFEGTGGDLFGRSTVEGGTGPLKGTDMFVSTSVFTPGPSGSLLELNAGAQGSSRTWGSEDETILTPTRLAGPGVLLGQEPGRQGSAERLGGSIGATGHMRVGTEHLIKVGVGLAYAQHEIDHHQRGPGEFVAGDEQRLTAGEYLFVGATDDPPPVSLEVAEFSLFGQYLWEPSRTLRISTGVRADFELLPAKDGTVDVRWFQLTRIPSGVVPKSQLTKISPRVGVEWSPTADGGTVLHGAFGWYYGSVDVGALYEVLSDAQAVRRELGTAATWPNPPSVTAPKPTFAMFAPRLDAPRTARGTFGVSQRLGGSTVLHLWGTLRSTELLLRREDLNRAPLASGRSSESRPVFGELVKLGSAVVAAPGSDRRFTELDAVWALTADGWSRYRGATVALERRAERGIEFFAHYTYSLTEDNLVGASAASADARVLPALDATEGDAWDEAVSDFDVPHRAAAGIRLKLDLLAGSELTGVYRFHSGLPFTAGYAPGVDVNGDGSWLNDPAFVHADAVSVHPCVAQDGGGIAHRNGCRGTDVQALDAHARLGLFRVGGSVASLTVDLFNLLDSELGRPDAALFLVREDAPLGRDAARSLTTLPLQINPAFGTVRESVRPGRLARVGFSVGLP